MGSLGPILTRTAKISNLQDRRIQLLECCAALKLGRWRDATKRPLFQVVSTENISVPSMHNPAPPVQ